MNTSRRNFFSFFGAAAVAAAGSSATASVVPEKTEEKADQKVIDQINSLPGPYTGKIELSSMYGEAIPPKENEIRFGPKYVPGTEKNASVTMVAGPDGHLYLKINDQWRKVVTV